MMGGNLAHQGEGYGDEEDVLMLSMEFENNTLGTMQYGSGFHWGEHYVKINGTLGSLYIDFKKSKILVKIDNQTTEYNMHDLPEENEDRQNLYKHLDGGIVYGSADIRPPLFIRNMMVNEMELLRDVVRGAPIPEE